MRDVFDDSDGLGKIIEDLRGSLAAARNAIASLEARFVRAEYVLLQVEVLDANDWKRVYRIPMTPSVGADRYVTTAVGYDGPLVRLTVREVC